MKRKKKLHQTKSLLQAKENHEKWLIKQGLSLKQIKAAAKKRERSILVDSPSVFDRYNQGLSNGFSNAGAKNDLWEKLRHCKESDTTIQEINRKAALCMPAYNKGGLQYMGHDKQSILDAGKKNPTEK